MQLVAYSESGTLVTATKAVKGSDYRCMECNGIVRRRGGIHRRDHFYHTSPTSECHLNGKSMRHLQVQWVIQESLPEGEAVLEKQFPEINRIADVCWEEKRIIFEVQCSPISREELLARNRDYGELGYSVVWILHDQRFNKRRVTAAEMALQKTNYYFTDIDLEGKGGIYDQLSKISKGIRTKRYMRFSVDLSSPQKIEGIGDSLKWFKKQKKYFLGDTLDNFLKGRVSKNEIHDFLDSDEERERMSWGIHHLSRFQDLLVRGYQRFFHLILEKSCR